MYLLERLALDVNQAAAKLGPQKRIARDRQKALGDTAEPGERKLRNVVLEDVEDDVTRKLTCRVCIPERGRAEQSGE